MNFLLLILIFLLVSCGNYEEFKDDPATSFTQFQTGREITFEEVQREVIGPKCLRCHANYDDYNTIKNKLNDIKQSVLTDYMPKDGPLSDSEKGLLLAWIGNGAPQGIVIQRPIEKEEGLVPTYESIARNILASKCTACHSPAGQVPFLDLSSRLSIFKQRNYLLDFDNPEQSYILEVISDPFEPMPPLDSPFEQVTDEELKILTEWIALGLP